MNASWRSLDNLRQSLGDVGEGVTSYLKGRREESERERNYEQLKAMQGPGGPLEKFDPNMLSAMFPASGYNAGSTVQNVMKYNEATAPRFSTITGKHGQVNAVETPSSALGQGGPPRVVGEPLIPGQPDYETEWGDKKDALGHFATATTPDGVKRLVQVQRQRVKDDPNAKWSDTGMERSVGLGTGLNSMGAEGALSSDQMDVLAKAYVSSGGTMRPNMPRDPLSVRLFNKSVAKYLLEQGGGENAGLLKAEFESHKKSLASLQQRISLVKSYESAAMKNIGLARQAIAARGGTPIPSLNAFRNWIQRNWTNNADLTTAETAVFTAVREYAKVATGSIGSAALTDAAMEEAERLLNVMQTPEQANAAMDMMQKDLMNVPKAIQEQIDTERDALGNLTRRGQGNAVDATTERRDGATPKKRRKYDPATGTFTDAAP